MNSSPEAFNNGWRKAPLVTAGPFKIGNLDQTAKTTTVVRDPAWWGDKAKLDKINFKQMAATARPDAFANASIVSLSIASDLTAYKKASALSGVTIRRALAPNFRVMIFNGDKGSILADPELRKALSKGINREAIAQALIGQILPDSKPIGNHIFVNGFPGYEDHSSVIAYDPEAAKKKLDDLGWKLDGDVRKKDGKQLVIRDVIPAQSAAPNEEPSSSRSSSARSASRSRSNPCLPTSSSTARERRRLRRHPLRRNGRRLPAVHQAGHLQLDRQPW